MVLLTGRNRPGDRMAKILFVHYYDLPLEEFLEVVFKHKKEAKDLLKLPNLKDREELERYEDDSVIRTTVRYYATGFIPPAVRRFVSLEMLSWLEYSTWHKDGLYWDWRVTPHFFSEFVDCGGRMNLMADGARTKRVTEGYLRIKAPVIGELGERVILDHLKRNLDLEVDLFHERIRRIREKQRLAGENCDGG